MWCHEGRLYHEGDEPPHLDPRLLGRCASQGTCYTSLTRTVGTVTAQLGCWLTDPSKRLEGKECLGKLGRELCLCSGSYCNLFLPDLREPQHQLQYWHALILLALVLLVLLALAGTAFRALRRHKSGRYDLNPEA